MPAIVVPKNALNFGAGYLYFAALGSSLPANTVAGSVFTDSWPGAWFPWGITKDGSEFDYDISVDQVEAAEYLDPLAYVTTGRVASLKFELMQYHLTNLKRALNGGLLSVSGSGATQLNTYTPPAPGAEVRSMIGWESNDNTLRFVMEQAFQVGTLAISFKKGADVSSIPVEFRGEVAASGFPFQKFSAGTLRG